MTVKAITHKVPPWTTLLGLALFVAALFWLHHVLEQYQWQDILAHVHTIPAPRLTAAVLLACGSYGFLTLYDALGLRYAKATVPYYRLAFISFMGFAIGHNVGLNTLSGGAIRYRAYTALGLSAKQIGTVIAFGTLTFALGAAVLLGVSLLLQAQLSATVLHVPAAIVNLAGVVLLGAVTAYLVLACKRHEPLRWRKFVVPVPSLRFGLAQVAVAGTDLLCLAGVLYVLLPPHAATGFIAFAGIFLIAIAAGIISNVPGGLGVFEIVLISLLPVPKGALLGALVAYRVIYYFIPFGIALTFLGAHELWAHRDPMVRVARLGRTYLSAVTPQFAGLAVFAAGAVLLFSSATPGVDNRLMLLRHFVPLPVLELSHLLGSAVGVGLLVIANGLYRRLDAAWWLTMWLLCAGILLSLLKGFDYEEATILATVAVLLVSARARFRRPASLIEQRFSGPWIVGLMAVLGAAMSLILVAYRHVPYDNDLWWQFAFEAAAPRSLRAWLVAVITAAVYALWRLLRPSRSAFIVPSQEHLNQAKDLIVHASDTSANLALLRDKNLLFNADRSAFIMYQVSGSSWVSMGDPVGPPAAVESLAWEFIEECDGMAVSPVFYQVSPDNLSLYIDLGLRLSKLGEEARVPLHGFSLDGPARADLRQAHRRALREGATFEVVPREMVPSILAQLRAVSDAWLEEKNTAEKAFLAGVFRGLLHVVLRLRSGTTCRRHRRVRKPVARGGGARSLRRSDALQRSGTQRGDRLSADRMHVVG